MSKYCYQPHGHIITGDLKIIENAKLRELVSKGPKYREPNKINWKATKNMIISESIDLYAERWAKREQDNLKYLSKGKETLKKPVTDRISGLKGKFKRPNQKFLNDPGVKDCLRKLHEDFVLVPADKAANSIIVIKDGLSRYCNTKKSHNGVNNMLILKNSTSLLSSLEKLDVRYAKSVQT